EGDSIRELLDLCTTASRIDIVDYLLDRILPAAYTQRPGQPPLIYDHETVQNALSRIANQMNQDGTRDLQWWYFSRWTPAWPRKLATGLISGFVVGLGVGLVTGLAAGLGPGLVAGFVVWAAVGLVTGLFWSLG